MNRNTLQIWESLATCPFAHEPYRNLHLALGIFDGLHLGHQAVVESARQASRHHDGHAAIWTFRPHPTRILAPQHATQLLFPPDARDDFLHRQYICEGIVEQEFTHEIAAIEASRFVGWLKQQAPALVAVHVGENFRFGQGRVGDVDTLVQTGRDLGVDVYSVEGLRYNGERISSSRIRRELEAGNLRSANAMLGRYYESLSHVQSGRRLGRSIGFPTLNLPWAPELQPRFGVYAVEVTLVDGTPSGQTIGVGVANYGLRPTVESAATEPLLEIHLLDAETAPLVPSVGNLLRVSWHEMMRPEQKFESVEVLRGQIARDVESARAYFRK